MAGVLCTKHTTHWLLMRQRPNSTLYHVPLPALSIIFTSRIRRRPSHGFERRDDGLRERCHPQAIRRPSRARACAVPQATRAPTCANVVDDASFSACGSVGRTSLSASGSGCQITVLPPRTFSLFSRDVRMFVTRIGESRRAERWWCFREQVLDDGKGHAA